MSKSPQPIVKGISANISARLIFTCPVFAVRLDHEAPSFYPHLVVWMFGLQERNIFIRRNRCFKEKDSLTKFSGKKEKIKPQGCTLLWYKSRGLLLSAELFNVEVAEFHTVFYILFLSHVRSTIYRIGTSKTTFWLKSLNFCPHLDVNMTACAAAILQVGKTVFPAFKST